MGTGLHRERRRLGVLVALGLLAWGGHAADAEHAATARVPRALFSDSLPPVERALLLESINAELAARGAGVTEHDPAGTADGFVAEIELTTFEWSVKEGTPERVWSSFPAGYQRVANPAYATALVRLQEALLARDVSRATLDQARGVVTGTPQYLDEPIYEHYAYVRRSISEGGRIVVHTRLVDVATRRLCTTEIVDLKGAHETTEVRGAHPLDRHGMREAPFELEAATQRLEMMKKEVRRRVAGAVRSFLEQAERCRTEPHRAAGEHDDLPAGSLLRRLATRASTAPSLLSVSAPLTAEEIVRQSGPAVVRVRTLMGAGSGFLVSRDGHIVTSAHVIANARDVAVHLLDGRVLLAAVVKTDARRDLAVLKVEGGPFTHLPVRAGRPPSPGETVLALGAPGGLSQTVTRGIVSAVRRFADVFPDPGYDPDLVLIQSDAAMNPGNSGGPLLDTHGMVIGVNTLKRSGAEGLGFAVSAEYVGDMLATATATSDRRSSR